MERESVQRAEIRRAQARRAETRRQGGSALFVAVLMLAMMGFLGVAALDTVSRDGEIAGFQNRARNAFYAAEAAVAEARAIVASPAVDDRGDIPAFHPQAAPRSLGDVALYDRELGALPRYYNDPTAANPIRYWKQGPIAAESAGVNLQSKGQKYRETYWRINVVGESPDGSQARIEAVATKLMASTAGGSH